MRLAALVLMPAAVMVVGFGGCGQSAEETVSNADQNLAVAAAQASLSLACFGYATSVQTLADGTSTNPDSVVMEARDKAEKLAREAGAELAAAVAADPGATYTVDGAEKSGQAILDEARATSCIPGVDGINGE